MRVRALKNVLSSNGPLKKGQVYTDLSAQDEKILLNMGAVERVVEEDQSQKETDKQEPKEADKKKGSSNKKGKQ